MCLYIFAILYYNSILVINSNKKSLKDVCIIQRSTRIFYSTKDSKCHCFLNYCKQIWLHIHSSEHFVMASM